MVRVVAVPALLTLFALVILPISTSEADTVHLKNGGKLEGTILKETPSGVRLEMGAGEMFVERDKIERIEREPAKKGAEKTPKPPAPGVPGKPEGEREKKTAKATTAETLYREFPFQMVLPKGWEPVQVEAPFLCILKSPSKTNVMVLMTPFGSRGLTWFTSSLTSRGSPFHGCKKVAAGETTVWMGADRIVVVRALDVFWSVGVLAEGRTPAAELKKIRELAEKGEFKGVTLRLAPGVDRKKGYDTALAAVNVFEAAGIALPGVVTLAMDELERRGREIDERTLAVILRIFAKPLDAIRQALKRH